MVTKSTSISGRDRHPVEILLPGARGDLIVHQHDAVDPERTSPADHHLSMDQPVVHPEEHDGHQGTRMALVPASIAALRPPPPE